jgi:hypothetical protein
MLRSFREFLQWRQGKAIHPPTCRLLTEDHSQANERGTSSRSIFLFEHDLRADA